MTENNLKIGGATSKDKVFCPKCRMYFAVGEPTDKRHEVSICATPKCEVPFWHHGQHHDAALRLIEVEVGSED